jgi:hypothetical protein
VPRGHQAAPGRAGRHGRATGQEAARQDRRDRRPAPAGAPDGRRPARMLDPAGAFARGAGHRPDVFTGARRVHDTGQAVYAVGMDLNARGIPTATGHLWAAASLSRVLTAARISGRREHTPVETYHGNTRPVRPAPRSAQRPRARRRPNRPSPLLPAVRCVRLQPMRPPDARPAAQWPPATSASKPPKGVGGTGEAAGHNPQRIFASAARPVRRPVLGVLNPAKWPSSTCPALANRSAPENGFSTSATPGSSLPWEARTGRA